jgi:WD40 repeat protein
MYSKRSLLIYRVLFAIAMLFSAHLSGRAQDQSITIVYEAPHANGIDSVAFSPNGKQVMSSGRDRALKLWDVASGHLVRTLQQHKDGAYVIVFSPDGSRVISESEDDTLKLWDTVTGEVIRTYQDQSGVGRVSFSPNGEYFLSQDLITPGGEGIRRWSRRAIRDFAAFNKPYDKTDVVNLWSSATGTRVQTFSAQAHVHAVWFSADGKELTFVVRDFGRDEPTEFQTWDVPSGRLIRAIRAGNGCNADEGAFSPDGTVYVARSIDSEQAKVLDAKVLHRPGSYTFVLCETASGRAVRTFVGDYLPIQVAFSPDGKRIVAGGYNNDVTIWNTASAKIVLTLKGHTDEVHAVSFSPDGNTIVSGSHDKTLKLWDASNGKMIKSLGASAETVASVAFSPDGTRALTGSFDGMLRLWDATNGRLIHTMVGDPNSVNAVTFSPDGRYLISGGDDHTVKLWDAVTGALIRTFQGHSDEVKAVAFSPDGSRVLSAGGSWPNARDTSIKLWDARSDNFCGLWTGTPNL